MTDALRKVTPTKTGQQAQARRDQIPNAAGGFVFKITPEQRLRRFLTIGTDGGTFYIDEQQLTIENATLVIDYAKNHPVELVDLVEEISVAGRAPRQNPAIFALAAVQAFGGHEGHEAIRNKLTSIVRTGEHMTQFVNYSHNMTDWNRSLRKSIENWYLSQEANQLAYQVIKYRQRNGWTHKDIFCVGHPNPADKNITFRSLMHWVRRGDSVDENDHYFIGEASTLPQLVDDFQQLQAATTVDKWVAIIHDNKSITHEMLPDAALREPRVWEALVENQMPMTALIRQLPRLTNLGVIGPGQAFNYQVIGQLTNTELLAKARVHPMRMLLAARTYAAGRGMRSTWTPVPQIVDALDKGFYSTFGNVRKTGKNILLALDVSSSMGSLVSSKIPISCREASAAIALVTASVEDNVTIVGFTSGRNVDWGANWRSNATLTPIDISPRRRLDDNVRRISNLPFGGTDCALPAIWATDNNLDFDAICIYTDNETWAGSKHPYQALNKYRKHVGHQVYQVVVGMTATDFSIADPTDPHSLDVAGLDASVPSVITDFLAGDA